MGCLWTSHGVPVGRSRTVFRGWLYVKRPWRVRVYPWCIFGGCTWGGRKVSVGRMWVTCGGPWNARGVSTESPWCFGRVSVGCQ